MSTITRSEVFTASNGEPAIRVVVVTQNEFAALVETIDSLYDGDSNPCPSCSCWHSQFDRCPTLSPTGQFRSFLDGAETRRSLHKYRYNDFRPQQQPNKRNKMSARYVVRKAEGIGGNPIPDDEPCFVVRGQDVLAPALLGEYILRYREVPGYDPEVEA